MITDLDVPDFDVEDFINEISKEDLTRAELLNKIKISWQLSTCIYIDCLKMQRGSLKLLNNELDICKSERDKFKKMIDDHPEFRLHIKMLERQKERQK